MIDIQIEDLFKAVSEETIEHSVDCSCAQCVYKAT